MVYSKEQLIQFLKYSFLLLVFAVLWYMKVDLISGIIIIFLIAALLEGWEVRSVFYGGCFLWFYNFLVINFRGGSMVDLSSYAKLLLFGSVIIFLIHNLIASFNQRDILSKLTLSHRLDLQEILAVLRQKMSRRFLIQWIKAGFIDKKNILSSGKKSYQKFAVILRQDVKRIGPTLFRLLVVSFLTTKRLVKLLASLAKRIIFKIYHLAVSAVFYWIAFIDKAVKRYGYVFIIKILILVGIFIGLLFFSHLSIYDIFIWIFFIGGLFFAWDSRIAISIALFFLFLCPYYLIKKQDSLAEIAAIYAYYFLVIGTIEAMIEVRRANK
jgi:hypothetical protein